MIICPHCGQSFPCEVDVTEGNAEFIVDCEICCRPIDVIVHIVDGEISDVEATLP